MKKESHLIFGALLFVIFYSMYKVDLLVGVLALVGAIFPDIDFKKGLRTWHRKILHNIWVLGIVVYAFFTYWNPLYGIAFGIGFISHMIADSLTPMGIYPFFPLSSRNYRFGRFFGISTGNVMEKVFMTGCVVATIFVVYFFII